MDQNKPESGHGAGNAQRMAKSLFTNEVNWQESIRNWFTSKSAGDYSFSRPSRRSQGNVILPGNQAPACGPIVIALDTSASISHLMLSAFLGEMATIYSACRPEAIYVCDCDSRVYQFEKFTDVSFTEFVPQGGGGTAFKPVFDRVEKEGIDPIGLVYLTDLEGSMSFPAPPYPVLWCDFNNYRTLPVSFGDKVKIQLDLNELFEQQREARKAGNWNA